VIIKRIFLYTFLVIFALFSILYIITYPVSINDNISVDMPGLLEKENLPNLEFFFFNTGYFQTRKFNITWSSSFKKIRLNNIGVLVFHPIKGLLVIDPGLGINFDKRRKKNKTLNFITNLSGLSVKNKQSLLEILKNNDIKANKIENILITHTHYDHFDAIIDFPGSTLWLNNKQEGFIEKEKKIHLPDVLTSLKLSKQKDKLKIFKFTKKTFGPFKKSFDFFGDQTVMLVPLSGHSPGQMGVIISSKNNKTIFLVGDTVWSQESIKKNLSKGMFTQLIADYNMKVARKKVHLLHLIYKKWKKKILMIAAHEPELKNLNEVKLWR